MGTIILIAVLVIIAAAAIISYVKKLSSGCCGAGADKVQKNPVSDTNAAHYPFSAEIKISDMSCKNCKLHIENALNNLDGVWAEVNLKGGTATVKMKNKIPEIELRRVIFNTGYTVTDVKMNY